jgi:hypothetical protein
MNIQIKMAPPFPARQVFVWGVVFIALVCYAFFYFAFGQFFQAILGAGFGAWNYSGALAYPFLFVKYMVVYNPLVALFGWLIWGYINSQKGELGGL